MKKEIFLHLGENITVSSDQIIGLFDLDNTTVSKKTRDFLSNAEKNGEVVYINNQLPKCFVVCKDKQDKNKKIVYVTQLSLQALSKRLENFDYEQF